MVSSEQEGFIPKESPFLISSIMLTPGEDVALPFIRADKQKDRAVVDGVALFHHKKMTGMLNDRQAQTFVMMRKDKAYGTLTEAIGPQATYVTFTFERSRQSIKLTAAKEGITADIQVSLNCALMDNPSGQFITDSMIKDMEQKLEKLLTTRAEQTVSQLQKANCDGLDIGLQLKALHNSEWSKLDWDREYSKIDIHPQIHVKIDNHGLLN
jgi:Ger(x)C family germination protein